MEKKVLMNIIGISTGQSGHYSNNYLLLLEEMNGNRRLPIVIGVFEAQSIAIALEKVKFKDLYRMIYSKILQMPFILM